MSSAESELSDGAFARVRFTAEMSPEPLGPWIGVGAERPRGGDWWEGDLDRRMTGQALTVPFHIYFTVDRMS